MNQQIPILLYHSISDHASQKFKPWAVSPSRFREHLTVLKLMGYTSLTVSDYVQCQIDGKVPPKPVIITFDDGFEDFYTNAFPILQEFEFSATLYVTTGYIGYTSRWLETMGEGERKLLTAEQIIELYKAGIEIGAHTATHPQLDTLPSFLAWKEIYESKQWLQTILGDEVRSFAYPHGYYNKKVRELVIDIGFSSACGVKHAISHPNDDRYAMARIIVKSHVTADGLKRLLKGDGLSKIEKGEKLKTKVWRLYRQGANQLNLKGLTV